MMHNWITKLQRLTFLNLESNIFGNISILHYCSMVKKKKKKNSINNSVVSYDKIKINALQYLMSLNNICKHSH